jgi:hypothetical protein
VVVVCESPSSCMCPHFCCVYSFLQHASVFVRHVPACVSVLQIEDVLLAPFSASLGVASYRLLQVRVGWGLCGC